MAEENQAATTGQATPPEKSGEWKSFTVNTSFHVAEPRPVYVIKNKKDGKYLRIPTTGGSILVTDRRLATRVDSRLWALTLAMILGGTNNTGLGKVVRLTTKEEREIREAREAQMKTYVFQAPSAESK